MLFSFIQLGTYSLNPRQGVGMHICKAGDEETEDVVVDGDDTAAFGQPQFNEHDIQTAAADHSSQEEGNTFFHLKFHHLY